MLAPTGCGREVMPKRPSSYDVARLAGVSQATVSMVLSGRARRISGETMNRVRQAAEELGYVVNRAGRTLATGRTGRIGFVPAEPQKMIANPYHRGMLSGAIEAAAELEIGLLIQSVKPASPEAMAAELMGNSVDAVVLLGRYKGDGLAQALAQGGLPVVCAAYRPDPAAARAAIVDIDKAAQGRLVARKLAERGHRRAAHCSGQYDCSWLDLFREGLTEDGALSVDELNTQEVGLCEKLAGGPWTAAVFSEEAVAMWAREQLAPIAPWLSIVSCLHFGLLNSPLLSGSVEPVEEIGSLAVRTAAALAAGGSAPSPQLVPVGWQEGATLGCVDPA